MRVFIVACTLVLPSGSDARSTNALLVLLLMLLGELGDERGQQQQQHEQRRLRDAARAASAFSFVHPFRDGDQHERQCAHNWARGTGAEDGDGSKL
jgi:hypothetical protein